MGQLYSNKDIFKKVGWAKSIIFFPGWEIEAEGELTKIS